MRRERCECDMCVLCAWCAISRDCSLLFAVMFLRVSVFVLGYWIVWRSREMRWRVVRFVVLCLRS